MSDKNRPTYNLVRVGDVLPDPPKRAGGGSNLATLFRDELTAIQGEPGVWFELVEYSTSTTAKGTAKRLVEQLTAAGGGLYGLGEFEFNARPKVLAGGKKGSALYARSMSHAVPSTEDTPGA